jgi:hypothetical protein
LERRPHYLRNAQKRTQKKKTRQAQLSSHTVDPTQ